MKVSIIGAGNVGSTAAMKIAAEGFVNEVVLLDVKDGVAEGKAMDIMQSLMMGDSETIVTGTTGDYSKTANSDVIVITSGVPRKPGMTREELVGVNSKVMTMVLDGATKYSPDAIYMIVSNPMDTMTQMAVNYMYDNFGQPKNSGKVFGMGGILDSARFKYNILMAVKNKYNLTPDINNAFVIGGHGDTTMIPLVDYVTVNEYSLDHFFSEDEINEIVEKTMKGGATLTKMLGTSAWEAPAQGICEMTKMIAFDENNETVASVYREGNGIDLCIGSRVKIGKNGVSEVTDEHYIDSHYIDFDYIREKYNASVEAIRNVNKAL